jgi:DNA mismatch repair protein MutL
VLPDALVDQIAAGEVVERPASVVKELVENALDAGAGRVRLELRAGGRDWIAVADDGCGMAPEDARLALRRHATSKIRSSEDLMRIASFGFRGEALPAIASVSRLRLRTRAAGAPEAFEIRVQDGRVLEERAAAGAEGTRVEVSDLFANVPARRKFLKSEATEWGHVADWVARAALALPGVHFELLRDDRPARVWPAVREPLDRIAAVVREEDAAAFVAVEREQGRARLWGFASRPDRHRASAAGIHLFVNRRAVRDRVLQHALLECYRDVLPRGRFPAAVLFLELPGEAVDVNVHPAKSEVRFADPRSVHQLVRRAVLEGLAARSWLGGAGAAGAPAWLAARGGAGVAGVEGAPRPAAEAPLPSGPAPEPQGPRRAAAVAPKPEPPAAPAPGLRLGELPLLGQLLATYLVLASPDQLLLVDQHAAHERVLYERLRAQWLARGVESQGLLVPVTAPLEARAEAALARSAEAVARLGFDLEPFGAGAVIVRSVPALLGGRDPLALVRDLAEELAAAGPAADPLRAGGRSLEAADRLFAGLACHGARRQGEHLDPGEQRALLESLDAIPWAPTCPHGRPVAVPISRAEIERRFARR